MTTEKTRTVRELAPGAAIKKLQELGTREDFIVHRVEEAAALARESAIVAYQKQIARIVGRVHPSAQAAVMKEAGINVPECFVPGPETNTASAAFVPGTVTSSDADELPAGARPLPPERLAIAEGRRR